MLDFYKITLRSVFLLDALGALLSVLMSGLVFPYFSSFLGIEPWIFKSLAGIALGFMIYDLVVYFKVQFIRPWMVKTVIFLNLSYCVLVALLILFLPNVSNLGLGVLLTECLVIILIVYFEHQVFQRAKHEVRTEYESAGRNK